MTIGTGFFGRSSAAENLHPSHLVQWTRLAYTSDPAEPFGDFTSLNPSAPSIPWQAPAGPVPPYPVASNQREGGTRTQDGGPQSVTTARSVHNARVYPENYRVSPDTYRQPDVASLRGA